MCLMFTDDQTRVRLMPYEGIDGSDYINANFIDVSGNYFTNTSYSRPHKCFRLLWLLPDYQHTHLRVVIIFS